MTIKKAKSVQEYIESASPEAQKGLRTLRKAIQQAAPKAEEVISYGMPAFRQDRILVWYAAMSKHFGLYPTASGVAAFKEELKKYKTSKGAIQFPMDKPLPLGLIKKIVRFRLKEVATHSSGIKRGV